MKKTLVICALLSSCTLSSFAYVDENKTSDISGLRAQGFSESMLKTVDLVNEKNKGINGTYVRYFTKKVPASTASNAYNELKLYVDPIQDDGIFGEHQINFTNTWKGDETTYSSQLEESNGTVENL